MCRAVILRTVLAVVVGLGTASQGSDLTQITLSSSRTGNQEIYRMNFDGSNYTQLTNNPNEDEHPSFNPDGRKIAFQSFT